MEPVVNVMPYGKVLLPKYFIDDFVYSITLSLKWVYCLPVGVDPNIGLNAWCKEEAIDDGVGVETKDDAGSNFRFIVIPNS